jgi:pimeloyl-ACP methyl ester carboxylesterase
MNKLNKMKMSKVVSAICLPIEKTMNLYQVMIIRTVTFILVVSSWFLASAQDQTHHEMTMNAQREGSGHYASVDGLRMYYEIHGAGRPLVLIHGGGSTIESTFGRVLPEFAKTHRVIAVELQAHGHTLDIDRPLSFEQDADDVAALLKQLKIEKTDIIGFSNGGTTALQIAIRHPELVNKLVLASTTFKREGMQPGFFEGFRDISLEKSMPQPLKEAYLKANPDPKGLQKMFDRDVARMVAFKDISDAQIKAIQAPAFVINGDADVVRPEHALELSRLLPHAKLAILPGGHGEYLGEICSTNLNSKIPILVTAMIEEFLKN